MVELFNNFMTMSRKLWGVCASVIRWGFERLFRFHKFMIGQFLILVSVIMVVFVSLLKWLGILMDRWEGLAETLGDKMDDFSSPIGEGFGAAKLWADRLNYVVDLDSALVVTVFLLSVAFVVMIYRLIKHWIPFV